MQNPYPIARIRTDPTRRRIFISDIHGNLDLFEALLKKIGYSSEDELYLLGDLIEKGTNSLGTLRFVLKLMRESSRVHAILGNCDCMWSNTHPDNPYHNDIVRYALWRGKSSLFTEMAEALSYPFNENTSPDAFSIALREGFPEESEFLDHLPYLLETEDFILAHAGLDGEDLERQPLQKVMRRDAFLLEAPVFSKTVIVGHWPTVNYCTEIASCLPRFENQKHIIGIDGGNEFKREGQLNALIWEHGKMRCEFLDFFKTAPVIGAQSASENPISIDWMRREVEILSRTESAAYCRHKATGRELWIENRYLYRFEDADCASYTDYRLPLCVGDTVSVIDIFPEKCFVKHNGVLGWADRGCLSLEGFSEK